MVKLMGHLAMGLLWAAPAWLLWDGQVSLAFVALVLSTTMLPDVDLLLRDVLPGVHHHGVTHTLLFGLLVSAVVGALVTRYGRAIAGRWWPRVERLPQATVFVFVTAAFLLGSYSHIFSDMLSAPDVAQPVEPLWPLWNKPLSLDVAYYSSIWWNAGLLAVAVAVHLVLAYLDRFPLDHPYKFRVG